MSPSHQIPHTYVLTRTCARLVCAAVVVAIALCGSPGAAVAASAGELDTSFNWAGPMPGTLVGPTIGGISDVAIDASGRTVVTGWSSTSQVLLARYMSDGSLDGTFDGPSGTGNGIFTLTVGSGTSHGAAVAVTSTDKVVVGGKYDEAGVINAFVHVLTDTGAPESGFNAGVARTLSFQNGTDVIRDLVIDGSGKIVFVGNTSTGTGVDILVGRLETTGALDSTFNFPNGWRAVHNTGDDYGEAITLGASGRPHIAGDTNFGVNTNIVVAAFNVDGSDYTSWAGTGRLTTELTAASTDRAYGISWHAGSNSFVVAGSSANNSAVLRLNAFGAAIDTFGPNGARITDQSGTGSLDEAQAAFIEDTTLKVIVAGAASSTPGTFYTRRFLSDGTPDPSWNGTGTTFTTFPATSWAYGAALTSAFPRTLTVVGQSDNRVALARYSADTPSLSIDINLCGSVGNTIIAPVGAAMLSGDCVVTFGTNSPMGASLMLEHDSIGAALQASPGPGPAIPDATGTLTSNTFGICRSAVGGGTSGAVSPCSTVSTGWQTIPQDPQPFAQTSTTAMGSVTFKFGVHPTSTTPARSYLADLTFTVVANP